MKTDPEELLKKHEQLVHSDNVKVTSHVQRIEGDWFLNTLMVEGCDAPFKYKRTEKYINLQGKRDKPDLLPRCGNRGGDGI